MDLSPFGFRVNHRNLIHPAVVGAQRATRSLRTTNGGDRASGRDRSRRTPTSGAADEPFYAGYAHANVAEVEESWSTLGEALAELAPPDLVFATTAAGRAPYHAGLRTVDLLGLCDPEIARVHAPSEARRTLLTSGLTGYAPWFTNPEFLAAYRPAFLLCAAWPKELLPGGALLLEIRRGVANSSSRAEPRRRRGDPVG